MPQYAPEELSRRPLIDERDTFDFTTPNLEVSARTTDPYVQPYSNLQQLVSVLSEINPTLRSIGQIGQVYNDKRKEQGEFSRIKGEETPAKSKGWAFIQGYEELDGKIKGGLDYKLEVQDYINRNGNLAPEEFANGLHAIAAKYTQGATDNFLRGFTDSALQIENDAKEAYQQAQFKKVQQDVIDKVSIDLTLDTEKTVQNLLKSSFKVGSLDDIVNNPALLKKMGTDKTFKDKVSTELRTILSTTQQRVKDLGATGLKNDDVTQKYLEIVGNMAVKYGMPELLDFTDKNDGSGFIISKSDKFGTMVADFKAGAERAKKTNLEIGEQTSAKQQEQALTQEVSRIRTRTAEISLVKDPFERAAQAREAMNYVSKSPMLTKNMDIQTLINPLQKIVEEARQGVSIRPDDSDKSTYQQLYSKAVKGSLSLEEVYKADNNNLLNKSDFDRLAGMVNTTLKERQRKAEEAAKKNQKAQDEWPHKQRVEELESKIVTEFAPTDRLGKALYPERGYEVQDYLTQRLLKWKEQKGRYPDYFEYEEEIATPARKHFKDIYEKDNNNNGGKDKEKPKDDNKGPVEKLLDNLRKSYGVDDNAKPPVKEQPVKTQPKPTSTTPPSKQQDNDDESTVYKKVETALAGGYNRGQLEKFLGDKSANYLTTYGRLKTRALLKAGTKEVDVRKKLKGWGYKDNEIDFYIKWSKDNMNK